MLDPHQLENTKENYYKFLISMEAIAGSYKLTSLSETSPFARCFAIFGLNLLKDEKKLSADSELLAKSIRKDLDLLRHERMKLGIELKFDKSYLQLLAFSLSALCILNCLTIDPLEDHVAPLVSRDIVKDLNHSGCLEGKPQSGNQAMFKAIILCHAKEFLNFDVDDLLTDWQNAHLESMNKFGFWGSYTSMTHLQFQNGYHQYEIFDYLKTPDVPRAISAKSIQMLADHDGHFAPYPGGGGCFDYDAIFIITSEGNESAIKYKDLITRTASSLFMEQNLDGGFCETRKVRPLSIMNFVFTIKHVLQVDGRARIERLKYALSLVRPKNKRIHTHWTDYSRSWDESNLWDSWFRMLTLARIDVALNPSRFSNWGFIDFPGIGFHSLLDSKKINK